MKAALIDILTGIVLNVIVANAAVDRAPEGTMLVQLPSDSLVDPNYAYDLKTKTFIAPTVVVVEKAGKVDRIEIVRATETTSKVTIREGEKLLVYPSETRHLFKDLENAR